MTDDRHDHDHADHSDKADHAGLSAAFAELRHRATHHFTAVDTTHIYREAKTRRTRSRNFSIAAALLAAAGMLTAGTVLQPPPPAGEREPLSTGRPWTPSSEQPTPPAAPDPPGAAGATRPDLANHVRFLDEEQAARLRNSTITLPPWPAPTQGCPAGTFTFTGGRAATGDSDYLLLHHENPGINSINGINGIAAELDGVPGDELVIPIACVSTGTGTTGQLLVVKPGPDPDSFAVLGYLPALPAFDRFYPYGEGLVVEVHNHPSDAVAEQRRRYGWNGTRFTQTHGPRTFPADLTPDVRRTDLRQSYFRLEQCGGGLLSFYDGVSGTWPAPGHPATRFELGEISTGVLREPGSQAGSEGDALVTVTCRPAGLPAQT